MDPALRTTPAPLVMPDFGVAAFASRHAPGFEMPAESHEFDELVLVDAGRGAVESAGRTTRLGIDDVVRIPAGTVHRFVDDPESPLTLAITGLAPAVVATPTSVALAWSELIASWPTSVPLRFATAYDSGEYRRVFRALLLELGSERPARAALVHAHAIHLLVLLRRAVERRRGAGEDQRGFAASLAALEDRLLEPVRIGELAELADMSYRSYTEHFRRHMGMTVNQYVTRRRIEFASRRMRETHNVLGSALEAGFRDASHFYRIFKRQTGRTPQAFLQEYEQQLPNPAGRPRGD